MSEQAYWVLKQLHNYKSSPDWFINFRCIHNAAPITNDQNKVERRTETVFSETVAIKDFKERWNAGLLERLVAVNGSNTKPANIYFTINPMLETKKQMKKENFAGYTAFYLDCDDNKSYTKEQRWAQIWYWTAMGFEPSFVIDSGHGYHVYWVLSRVVTWTEWEAILRRMVMLAGCKDKGNTFDVTRIFRLPGFANVKEWHKNDKPACFIAWPPNWQERDRCLLYDPEVFNGFPPSELTDLQQYYQEAARRTVDNPGALQQTLTDIVRAAAEASRRAGIQQAGERIFNNTTAQANARIGSETATAEAPHEPMLRIVPAVDEIKWPRGGQWMKKYAKNGYAGLTQGDLDDLRVKLNMQDVSASELDFKVIYHLVKTGYTRDAVHEFWMRGDVKLYRPDKEQKNPQYFDMTYNKALDFVRSAIEQRDPSKSGKGDELKITTADLRTYIVGGEKPECILTGEVRLNAIYIDQDALTPHDREWFDCTIICTDTIATDGNTTASLLVPNRAFASVAALKEYSHDLFRVVTNNNAFIQRFAEWLVATYRNAPRYLFHSNIVYKSGKYVFPQFVIAADKTERQSSVPKIEMLSKKYPLFAAFMEQSFEREKIVAQLRQHWHRVLKMHLPRTIISVFGLITSSGIRPRFEQETTYTSFHLPTVNIRGASHTAKTETVAYLCTVMGIRRDKFVVSTSTTSFALTKMLSSTNFLPIVVDEFKDEEDQNSKRNMDSIRQIARRIYSGETIYKGRSDLSYVGLEVHGAMMIIGEAAVEREGNVSEFTRVVPINTDEFQPAKSIENYGLIEHLSWHELCPLFYRFLAQQDVNELLNEFIALRNEVLGMISNAFGNEKLRVAHNLATLWFGCRVFDRFITSLDAALPTIEVTLNPRDALVKYTCDYSVEAGQSLVANVPTETGVIKQVFANNELWSAVRLYSDLLSRRHEIVAERIKTNAFLFRTDENPCRLSIHLDTLVEVLNEYHLKMRTNVVVMRKKLHQIAKASLTNNEQIVLEMTTLIRTKIGFKRCVILNLTKLRDLGIWMDTETTNILEQEITLNSSTTSQEPAAGSDNAQGGLLS